MSSNSWNPSEYIKNKIESIRYKIGKDYVLCLVNNDLNSAIIATILHQALGNQVKFVFIDTGLISTNEEEKVNTLFNETLGLKLIKIKTNKLFLNDAMMAIDKENQDEIILNTFMEVLCNFIETSNIPFRCIADGSFFTLNYNSKSKQYNEYIQSLKELDLLILQPLRNLNHDQILNLADFIDLPISIIETNWNSIYGIADVINGPITKKKLEIYSKIYDLYVEEMHKHKISIINTKCIVNFLEKTGFRNNNSYDKELFISLEAIDITLHNDSKKTIYLNLPFTIWTNLSKAIKAEIPEIKGITLNLTN